LRLVGLSKALDDGIPMLDEVAQMMKLRRKLVML
jgi:hypothetical protein